MTTTPVTRDARRPVPSERRVRHQARDVVAVMTFSAATSLAIAAVLIVAGGVLGSGR